MQYLPLDPKDVRIKREKDQSIILVSIAWRETGAYLKREHPKRFSPWSKVGAIHEATMLNNQRKQAFRKIKKPRPTPR